MTDAKRSLVGVNLPWLFGAYGHDLAPNERRPGWPAAFEPFAAYRPFVEARELGFEAVRVWLCEAGEGIVTVNGVIDAVHPALLDSVRALQEGAKLAGLRVYWTLLDAHTWAREEDAITRAIVADPDATQRFAERVAAPIAHALDPEVTLALELLHEPEALTEGLPEGRAAVSWDAIRHFLRVAGDAVREARPGTLVTSGTRAALVEALSLTGLDAVDVHVGGAALPPRAALGGTALPLVAQCWMGAGDDPEAALAAADAHGYAAVFLGRLEGDLVDAKAVGRPLTEAGTRVRALLAQRAAR